MASIAGSTKSVDFYFGECDTQQGSNHECDRYSRWHVRQKIGWWQRRRWRWTRRRDPRQHSEGRPQGPTCSTQRKCNTKSSSRQSHSRQSHDSRKPTRSRIRQPRRSAASFSRTQHNPTADTPTAVAVAAAAAAATTTASLPRTRTAYRASTNRIHGRIRRQSGPI